MPLTSALVRPIALVSAPTLVADYYAIEYPAALRDQFGRLAAPPATVLDVIAGAHL